MTRTQLENAILAFLRRASVNSAVAGFAAVGTFITLAETHINGSPNPPDGIPPGLRTRCQVARVGIDATDRYVTLPDDFLEMDDLRLDGGPALTYWPRAQAGSADQAQFLSDSPTPQNVGDPLRYSVIGLSLELWPPPSTESPAQLRMAYFRASALGSDPAATNAVLTHVPNAYLYGALAHAAAMLGDDERIASHTAAYTAAVMSANAAYRDASIGRGPLTQRFRSIG